MRKPKATKAPRKPSKPSKPNKVLTLRKGIYIDSFRKDKGASIQDLINHVPEGVELYDVFLYMGDYNDYDYNSCCSSNGYSTLDVYYMEDVENPHYERQMTAYNKKLTKYNDKMEDFKFKLGEWEIKNEEFLEELDLWTAEQTEIEINKLERTLKKLKAS